LSKKKEREKERVRKAKEQEKSSEETITCPSEVEETTGTHKVVEPVEEEQVNSDGLSMIARSVEAVHGEHSVMYLGEHPDYGHVKRWVSTQNRALDWIISGKADGTGGLPSGRIVEFFGDPSSGKSLLLAHVLAETQKRGGIAALVDAEATFDWKFAEHIGLDPNNMLYSTAYEKTKKTIKVPSRMLKPEGEENGKLVEVEIETVTAASVERTAKIISDLIDVTRFKYPNSLFVIGLDSVAILTTEHELDQPDKRDLTKAQGLRKFVRELEGKLAELDILLICTNHTIARIDMNPFVRKVGPKETKVTPGGSGLPFGSSLRLDLNRGIDIKEKHHGTEIVTGHQIWAFTHKSKVFPARKRILLEMNFDKGLDPNSGLLDILVAKGVIEEMGSAVYRYKGERFKSHKMDKYKGFDEIVERFPEILTAANE